MNPNTPNPQEAVFLDAPNVAALALNLWKSELRAKALKSGKGARPARRPKAAFTVRDLPSSERPRERMQALGPEALSLQELLACLLGSGSAGESVIALSQKLLQKYGSLDKLAQASVGELARVSGIGQAKAVQLKAAFEIGRRLELAASYPSSKAIETVETAIAAARKVLSGKKKEHFVVILLDSRHRVLRASSVSIGTLDMSVVHPRETFREAITEGAAAIIVAHNHPSGDPDPSPEDVALTRRLMEAGQLIGIPVLDHLIIAGRQALSLRAMGFLEE